MKALGSADYPLVMRETIMILSGNSPISPHEDINFYELFESKNLNFLQNL